jgi:hypothetical protein
MLETPKVAMADGAGTPRFELSADPMDVIAATRISLMPSSLKVTADNFNVKQTSQMALEEGNQGDEAEELYGVPQSLAIHAPKKSSGGMSRMSASSDRGDRMNELFIAPFIRAATRFNESRYGRLLSTFMNRVLWFAFKLMLNRHCPPKHSQL